MRASDFDFKLPRRLIAQSPLGARSSSRLLCLTANSDQPEDRRFSELPSLLRAGDLLVVNDTKVVRARLAGTKASGGRIEVLVERAIDAQRFLAHVRASRAPKPGSELVIAGSVRCQVIAREADLFVLSLPREWSLEALMRAHGTLPLPPYIARQADVEDEVRYQTVYAQSMGAVAAPTAGLHFDADLLRAVAAMGVERGVLTLHVGAGTFSPLRCDDVSAHRMHRERFRVSAQLVDAVQRTRARGARVVAVGTTCVRALESAAMKGSLRAFEGETNLFITPGFPFRVVDVLISNFHLPRSTLLMLVSAFAGRERVLAAYAHAVRAGYRFFSYGDATWLERHQGSA